MQSEKCLFHRDDAYTWTHKSCQDQIEYSMDLITVVRQKFVHDIWALEQIITASVFQYFFLSFSFLSCINLVLLFIYFCFIIFIKVVRTLSHNFGYACLYVREPNIKFLMAAWACVYVYVTVHRSSCRV